MGTILIVAEIQNGKIRESSFELVTLANNIGGDIKSVVIGSGVSELATDLVGSTAYHWRVRLKYDATTTPLAQHSRWLTVPWKGWHETMLRTACAGGGIPLNVESLSGSKTGPEVTFGCFASAGATAYDALRGPIGEPVGSNPATETCIGSDLVETTVSDEAIPPVGTGYWYVIRAKNACGNSSYGFERSLGTPTSPRLSSTCVGTF